MKTKKIPSLLMSTLLLSCVHTQRHNQQADRSYYGDIVRSGDLLKFTAQLGDVFGRDAKRTGAELDDYQFANAPAVIKYADGTKIEVWPEVVSRQFKQHVESKFPVEQGYHSAKTSKEWVYKIQKETSTWGVRSEKTVATYDATPKDEKMELGRLYQFPAPDDGYERRVVFISLSFPFKHMDIDISVPARRIDSLEVKSAEFHFKYTDKWEFPRLAP